MITYRLTVELVEPSGTELADKVSTIMVAEGNLHILVSVYNQLEEMSYRLRLVEITTEEHHHTIKFRRASTDNPFVT